MFKHQERDIFNVGAAQHMNDYMPKDAAMNDPVVMLHTAGEPKVGGCQLYQARMHMQLLSIDLARDQCLAGVS